MTTDRVAEFCDATSRSAAKSREFWVTWGSGFSNKVAGSWATVADEGFVVGIGVWATAARSAGTAIAAEKHTALIHRGRITLPFIVDPAKLPYLPRGEKASAGGSTCKNSVKIALKMSCLPIH